jgi:YVTN family beta-propeller protein
VGLEIENRHYGIRNKSKDSKTLICSKNELRRNTMKRYFSIGITALFILAIFAGFFSFGDVQAASHGRSHSTIVVANRGSGDISVIDARRGELLMNVPLPQDDGDNFPEPMYVVYTRPGDRVFVGDRANNRVVVFDADDFSVVGTVPTGAGVFHMWADPRGKQLWVNNDIDNTTTVINPRNLTVITTIATPADLVAMGGKPHDVILGPAGKLAYISVLGLSGDNDYVVQFRTDTFEEIGRVAVGKDPHLSLNGRNRYLYVPTQGNNAVYILNRFNMNLVDVLEIPGAHGAGMGFNGRFFYTTNLPGGGTDALFTIDTKSNTVIGDPVDSPYAVPHNIALTLVPDKLYLTHSGATSDKVTFYDVSNRNPIPVFAGEVTVGLNPFGISFVP